MKCQGATKTASQGASLQLPAPPSSFAVCIKWTAQAPADKGTANVDHLEKHSLDVLRCLDDAFKGIVPAWAAHLKRKQEKSEEGDKWKIRKGKWVQKGAGGNGMSRNPYSGVSLV